MMSHFSLVGLILGLVVAVCVTRVFIAYHVDREGARRTEGLRQTVLRSIRESEQQRARLQGLHEDLTNIARYGAWGSDVYERGDEEKGTEQ